MSSRPSATVTTVTPVAIADTASRYCPVTFLLPEPRACSSTDVPHPGHDQGPGSGQTQVGGHTHRRCPRGEGILRTRRGEVLTGLVRSQLVERVGPREGAHRQRTVPHTIAC